MDLTSLTKFLLSSNAAGYAGGDAKKWLKEKDGSTTIPYQEGSWTSHDNYFGGEPYGGRIVVSFEQKPVWLMVYYGWVQKGVNADDVYVVLQDALKQMPEDAPFRGPKEFRKDGFTYLNFWQGTVERYSGQEQIKLGDKVLYEAHYMGGLVDQKS
jgi:hypothetical protein